MLHPDNDCLCALPEHTGATTDLYKGARSPSQKGRCVSDKGAKFVPMAFNQKKDVMGFVLRCRLQLHLGLCSSPLHVGFTATVSTHLPTCEISGTTKVTTLDSLQCGIVFSVQCSHCDAELFFQLQCRCLDEHQVELNRHGRAMAGKVHTVTTS